MSDEYQYVSVEPTYHHKIILSKGFFGQQSMLCGEWFVWAKEYLNDTNVTLPVKGRSVSLTHYYDLCMLLQRACIKYIEESTNEPNP